MNPLANELNEAIQHTAVYRMLSELGRKMFFPKGIVAQSAEAKKKAKRMNATIGMAYKDGQPFALPLLDSMLPTLSEAEAVSYAPTGGIPRLRELWREQQLKRNPGLRGKSTTLPMVVAGLTSGIFQMAELFVNPGDRVIVPDMFWGNYKLILSERREAVIDGFPFFTSEGTLNTSGFKEQLHASLQASRENGGRGKVIILLNFPNNPTGYSPTEEEAKQLSAAILEAASEDNDILTVHDDAYFGLFYEENIRKESLFTDCSDLHENVVALKVDGATKEEYAWGFRVGFMTFASKGMTERDFHPMLQKLMGSIRGTVSNCPGLSQNLLIQMLQHPEYASQKQAAAEDLKLRYQKVRSLLDREFQGSRGEELSAILSPLPFNSGYFMAFRTSGVSAEKLRLALLEKGIGSIAIGEDYLRIAFAAVDQDEIDTLYSEIITTARELHES